MARNKVLCTRVLRVAPSYALVFLACMFPISVARAQTPSLGPLTASVTSLQEGLSTSVTFTVNIIGGTPTPGSVQLWAVYPNGSPLLDLSNVFGPMIDSGSNTFTLVVTSLTAGYPAPDEWLQAQAEFPGLSTPVVSPVLNLPVTGPDIFSILNFSPTSGPIGTVVNVALNNIGTFAGEVPQVSFPGLPGSITAPTSSYSSTDGTLSFVVPSGAISGNISVSFADYALNNSQSLGSITATSVSPFTVTPTPASYTISGQVALSGSGLGGVTMTLSGSQSNSTTTDGSGTFGFTVPAGGHYTVTPSLAGYSFTPPNQTFSNLSGNQSGANFVANPPMPLITSLSPSSATVGGAAFPLTVNGTGFLSGATVQWNGSALSTSFVSSTQLTASVSASLIASAAIVTVTVSSGEVTSSSVSFSVMSLAPAITGLSPNSANAGGAAFTLTVNGTGFVSGAAVAWNNSPLNTTFVGAAQLTASVAASLIAAAGSASVSVTNPGGAASSAVNFTIIAVPQQTVLATVTWEVDNHEYLVLNNDGSWNLTDDGGQVPYGVIVNGSPQTSGSNWAGFTQSSAFPVAGTVASITDWDVQVISGQAPRCSNVGTGSNPNSTVSVISTTSTSITIQADDDGPCGSQGRVTFTLQISYTQLPSVTEYVNPKYLIMGVTYAPPGGNSLSYVSYQNSNIVGNSTTISNSFTQAFQQKTAITAGVGCANVGGTAAPTNDTACPLTGIPGFSASASITYSQSSGWTQKTTNQNQITVSKTTSTTLKTPGVPNVYSPVDHDYDIIWLWLNPLSLFTLYSLNGSVGGGPIVWNGYGYDADDQPDIDVVGIYVGWLNGDLPLPAGEAGILSRSWVPSTQQFGPGQGPGITSADYANILRADPFAYNPYDSNSGCLQSPCYLLTLAPGTNPPTSADGRFSLSTGSTTPQSVPYQQAPLNSTTGTTDTYVLTNSTSTVATQIADYMYSVSWGLEEKFGVGFFGVLNASGDLTQTWTMTWENMVTTSVNQMITQTDTAQITSPPCPATTAPCNPTYTEPHEFAIYQDNLYGTFMFWPNPYFSISKLAPATNTVSPGGTATYVVSTLANAGYTGTSIGITVTGLPAGAIYNQNIGAPGTNFTLSINTASSTPTGTYPLAITAADGSLSYFAYASLVVSAANTVSLSSLSPNSVTAGGLAFTLTVNGSSFLTGSTVQWNGSALATSYVSSSQLTASVPATLIASPGSASIMVINPGGGASNALTFTINTQVSLTSLTILTPSPLPNGTVGVTYSQGFTATGGITPYKGWAVAAGSLLPPGMSLTQGVLTGIGLLSGTPTSAGTFTFTIQVTDSANAIATAQFSLTITGGTMTVSATGIVNAAGYQSGSVSPGEIIVIFGSFPGPAKIVSLELNSQGNVSTNLSGMEVSFDGIQAPMIYALAGQISCVVPYEVAGKTSTMVQASYQGQLSNSVAVPVAAAVPGIFTANASGSGQGAIINEDGTVNSATNPAALGSIVEVYATGEGQTNPAGVDGKPDSAPLPQPVTQPVIARVGGVAASVEYAGGVSGLVAGVLQVNVQIPKGVSTGSAIPIVLSIGGTTSQASVTVAIH